MIMGAGGGSSSGGKKAVHVKVRQLEVPEDSSAAEAGPVKRGVGGST